MEATAERTETDREAAFDTTRCEIVDGRELTTIDRRCWERLLCEAAEPNPYFSKSYVLAASETIDKDRNLHALAFRAKDDGRLTGLLPFAGARIGPFRAFCATSNAYQFSAAPLIEAGQMREVVASLLSTFQSSLRAPWIFKHLDVDGPFLRELSVQAPRAGWTLAPIRRYRRPIFRRGSQSFDDYIAARISKKRIKNFARNRRNLERLGELRFERASEREAVSRRLDEFLALEHSGWKGRAGTSLRSDPEHERFFRTAIGGAGTEALRTTIDSLLLDETPIAMAVHLTVGGTMFTPKCAYDERYRRYGPGSLLEYMVIAAFHQSDAMEMDASTTTDDTVLLDLWNGERAMADMVLVPDTFVGRGVLQALRLRRNAIDTLRALQDRWRGSLPLTTSLMPLCIL